MTIDRPTTLPQWADQDQVDSVSNQNNVLEPPEQKKLFGWDRQEFPPRNWFNWLARYTYRWLAYFAQNDSRSQTVIFQGTYGVLTPVGICDPTIPSIVNLYIVDDTGGSATDYLIGIFTPRSSSPNRVVNVVSNVAVTVSDVDFTTGKVTVSTSGGGSTFQLVAVQYQLGV